MRRAQRIYKAGEPGAQAYVLVSGQVQVTTVDEDQQEVVVDEPGKGEFFGFASMLEQTPHQTSAVALEECVCLEVSRNDIAVLLQRKPQAGMDLLTTLGHQFTARINLVRLRATRNANEIIEKQETFGERIADAVAGFGGSWTFIIAFAVVLVVYTAINVLLDQKGMGSLSVHPAEPVSFDAGCDPGARDHDEPESAGYEGPVRSELDFEVNRRSETEIQGLARKINQLDERVGDVYDLLKPGKVPGLE